MQRSQLALAISSALLSMTTSNWVQAQDDGQHARGLEQVIVSARRVEENVQDVPLAITAMSAEQIEKSGIANIGDLRATAPSVQVQYQTGRRDASTFAIRGQKADDVLLTSDQAIAMIIGGVPILWPYGTAQTGTLDVSSIEVAKGPQGTLFGKNSTGGAILITPNEPNRNTEGRIKVGAGNYDLRQLEGMYNTPLTESFSVRIAASATKQDGLVKNLDGGDDFNSTDQWAARVSLKWEGDSVSNLLVWDHAQSAATGTPTKLVAGNANLPPLNGVFPAGFLYSVMAAQQKNDDFWSAHGAGVPNGGDNDLRTWGVADTLTLELSDALTVKNILSYRDLWYEGLMDLDGTNFTAFGLPAIVDFSTAQYTYGGAWTEELQLIGSSELADWIIGAFYSRMEGKDGANSNQFSHIVSTGPTGGVVNESSAVFGQSTWHLTDRMNLTTGLRYTVDKREVKYDSHLLPASYWNYVGLVGDVNNVPGTCLLVDDATGSQLNPCLLKRDKTFSEPTWNLTLDYKLTDTQLVYAATRHGYRAGGFPGRASTTADAKSFDPETVIDFEVGHKIDSDFKGMPFRMNTAVFYQDYKDIQRNVTRIEVQPNGNSLLKNTVENAAEGTLWGGELEFTIMPTDSLTFSGYFSYIDASYDKWDACPQAGATGACLVTPVDRSPNTFQSVPKKSGSLKARYTLPLSSAVGEVAVQADVYYQDKTSLYVDNKVDNSGNECIGSEQGSYKIYNARVDWDGAMGNEGLSFSAWGKNLGNEEYYTGATCLYNQIGSSWGYIGDPRTFGVTAAYKF